MIKNSEGNWRPSKYKNIGYRISKLEKKVKNNTPELKEYQFVQVGNVTPASVFVYDLTAGLGQGTSESERLGNAVNIVGIKISAHTNSPIPDMLLTRSPHGLSVSNTDLVPQPMTDVLYSSTDDVKIMKRLRNFGSSNQYVTYNRRFKTPIHVTWSDSTSSSVNKNRICFVVSNYGGSTYITTFNVTLYFRDA